MFISTFIFLLILRGSTNRQLCYLLFVDFDSCSSKLDDIFLVAKIIKLCLRYLLKMASFAQVAEKKMWCDLLHKIPPERLVKRSEFVEKLS